LSESDIRRGFKILTHDWRPPAQGGDQWDRWQPCDVRVANEVEYALIVYSAVSQGWLSNYEANHLTVGIRDAYYHGLAIAVPTGPSELRYAMDR
jgi:hypothetical protein